jgi:hypothetical protein
MAVQSQVRQSGELLKVSRKFMLPHLNLNVNHVRPDFPTIISPITHGATQLIPQPISMHAATTKSSIEQGSRRVVASHKLMPKTLTLSNSNRKNNY